MVIQASLCNDPGQVGALPVLVPQWYQKRRKATSTNMCKIDRIRELFA